MPLARCGIRCGSKRVPRGSANGPGSGLGWRKYLRSRGPSGPPRSGESGKNGSTSVETTGHLSMRGLRGSANRVRSGLGWRKYLRSRGPSGPSRSGESGKNGSTSVETTGHLSMRGLRGSANGPGSSLGCRCHFADPGPARAVARSGTMAQPLSRRPVTCRCAL